MSRWGWAVVVVLWACGRDASAPAPAPALPRTPAPATIPESEDAGPDGEGLDAGMSRRERMAWFAGALARHYTAWPQPNLVRELMTMESEASREGVTYAALQRNADEMLGRSAFFAGKVLEIHDTNDGGSVLRVGTKRVAYVGTVADPIWVVAAVRPGRTIVRDANVRVYGVVSGTETYQSQAGWTITIPRIHAVAIVPASFPRSLTRAQLRALPADPPPPPELERLLRTPDAGVDGAP